MDAFLKSLEEDNAAGLNKSTNSTGSLQQSSLPRKIHGGSSALDALLKAESYNNEGMTPANTPAVANGFTMKGGTGLESPNQELCDDDEEPADGIRTLHRLGLTARGPSHSLYGGASALIVKDEILSEFASGAHAAPHVDGSALPPKPLWDNDDGFSDDDDSFSSFAGGMEHGMGFTRQIRNQLKSEQRRLLTDHLSMLIDDSQLALLVRIESYVDYCKEVVIAAAQLIRDIGIDKVVSIQLSPNSNVDDMGRLQSYALMVAKSAPIEPIMATMPNYGAGRSVFTDIKQVRNASRYGEITFDEARAALQRLFRPDADGNSRIVDYSSPQSEKSRKSAHTFLASIRSGSNIAGEVISESFVRNAHAEDVAKNVASDLSEEEKLRLSQFVSLGSYETSVGIFDYNRRPAVICDNYSQISVDLIHAKIADGSIRSVADFLNSPVRNLAIEHGRIVRGAVIAHVVDEIDDAERKEFEKAPVSFMMTSQKKVHGRWTVRPTVANLEYDHVYNHIRSVTERSDEWQMFLARYEGARKEIGGDVYEAHRRLLESPASDYAIVFNHMNDPRYSTQMGRGASEKNGFTIDMGKSTGVTVVKYNPKARVRSGFLGVPVSGIKPPNRAVLKKSLVKRMQDLAEESVGYSAELHNLDILPLEISAFHTEDQFRSTFADKDTVERMMKIHTILRDQFINTLSFDDIDQPELFRNVYIWASSVDPSMLSLRRRLEVADPSKDLIIDGRHTEQLQEVFGLLVKHMGRLSNKEDADLGLLQLIQVGSERANPTGYVLSLKRELAFRLLDGW